MPQADREHAAVDPAERAGLSRRFILILLVEVVTIVALFVFGRHFGQP